MNFLATDWAAKWARYSPDKIALKEYDTQRTLSYAELNRKGSSLAAYFQQQGLKKGDRIGVIAEYSLEFILVFVAAQKSGMIIVPLNYRLTSAELDYMVKDAAPALLIYQEDFGTLIQACSSFASIPRTLKMVDLGEYSAKESMSFSSCHLQADDPIFILYTSGTTGFPKGSIYTHGMLFWNSINTAMSLLINTESRTVNFMPPFHTGGWNVLLTPLWHHGGYVCLLKKFEADQVLEALEEEQATLCMAVPTMLGMLKDEKGFAQANLSRLHYMIVGGEAMPIPLIEIWHEKGIAIRQGFGMTEVGPNLFSLHQRDAIRKKGSIGFPNFYLETRIEMENGEEAKAGEAGELLLKGAVVSPGYWKNPKASEASRKDGWFRTGDRVMKDEEGYFFVIDRIKNMYISGGENVYPAEIEKVLCAHPEIEVAVVVGIPDPKWGETGKAYVVRNEELLSEERLRAYCKERLARFKIPGVFSFVTELPKNATGKIDRKKLRAAALEK